jgi:hypothetical protein
MALCKAPNVWLKVQKYKKFFVLCKST